MRSNFFPAIFLRYKYMFARLSECGCGCGCVSMLALWRCRKSISIAIVRLIRFCSSALLGLVLQRSDSCWCCCCPHSFFRQIKISNKTRKMKISVGKIVIYSLILSLNFMFWAVLCYLFRLFPVSGAIVELYLWIKIARKHIENGATLLHYTHAYTRTHITHTTGYRNCRRTPRFVPEIVYIYFRTTYSHTHSIYFHIAWIIWIGPSKLTAAWMWVGEGGCLCESERNLSKFTQFWLISLFIFHNTQSYVQRTLRVV